MNYSCSDDLSLPWPGLTFHCTTKADSVDDVFLFSAAEGEKNERFYLGRDMPFLMHFGWFETVTRAGLNRDRGFALLAAQNAQFSAHVEDLTLHFPC